MWKLELSNAMTSAKYHYALLVCYAVDRSTNGKHTRTHRNFLVKLNGNDLGGLKDLYGSYFPILR